MAIVRMTACDTAACPMHNRRPSGISAGTRNASKAKLSKVNEASRRTIFRRSSLRS